MIPTRVNTVVVGAGQAGLAMSAHFGDKPVDPDFKRFQEIVADYPFKYANDLDKAVIDGAEAGYFVESRIRGAAEQIEAELKANSRNNALSRAWHELYHGSLATTDDEFLDAVHEGALKDAAFTNAVNINSAIYILRECGREDQADEVLSSYMEAHANQRPEFFDISEVNGGTPYGASTIAGGDGSRQPSEKELAIARFQGKHVAELAVKLHG